MFTSRTKVLGTYSKSKTMVTKTRGFVCRLQCVFLFPVPPLLSSIRYLYTLYGPQNELRNSHFHASSFTFKKSKPHRTERLMKNVELSLHLVILLTSALRYNLTRQISLYFIDVEVSTRYVSSH